MTQKTVCVVTGTRAEYGLLRPVLEKIQACDTLSLRLVVTGAHLSAAFGNTVSEIEADGIPIHARIDILKYGTSSLRATAHNTHFALGAFLDYFEENRPDAVLILGDRYEIFAVGQAASLLGIPLAHISGGDVTHGATDDWFRHCLTKMAQLHFPACEEYAQRVIRMGENPSTVENVGGLGDENLRNLPLLSREALSQSINLDLTQPYVLVTYHPETIGQSSPVMQFGALLDALAKFDLRVIFTKANADAGGIEINRCIDEACENKNYIAFTSMGVLRYLSAMKYCAAVIGNSSSGVVETPSLGVPAVNIGNRQSGRIICPNVLCCSGDTASIETAIATALSASFAQKAHTTVSPYYGGDTSTRIVKRLADWLSSESLHSPKIFYDGEE